MFDSPVRANEGLMKDQGMESGQEEMKAEQHKNSEKLKDERKEIKTYLEL